MKNYNKYNRYFSLDVYGESDIYSFQFKIISNNENLDECLYKIYSVLFDSIFMRTSLNKGKLIDNFEFYLNENFTNGDVIPIYTSADEDTQIFLKYNMSYFRDKYGKKCSLNVLISSLVANKNDIYNFKKFTISFDKLMCPKNLVNGIATNDMIIDNIHIVYNVATLDHAICFKINFANYEYYIVFSENDFNTLFYNIKHEIRRLKL